mgnify:CR=1 FL=1
MKKVLITGGNGNLAKELLKTGKGYVVYAPSKEEMDITDISSIRKVYKSYQPNYVIHAAAFTRPMSKHEKYPEKSIKINIVGTSNIVMCCLDKSIKLIYVSTDYVYPGQKGDYTENDPLSPFSKVNDGVSKYGWSKLGGECAVRFLNNSLILRACICEYPFPHPKALTDVKKSLIYIKDAAPIIWRLIDYSGVINLGGISQTVYEFAKKDFKDVIPLNRSEVGDVLIAPDTSMNISKLNNILNGES